MRVVSIHDSDGVSDQLIDATVKTVSSAKAPITQMPRSRIGARGSRASTSAAAHRPAPASMSTISVQVVRSSCDPPRATNAHAMTATATPTSTAGAAGGSGTSIAGSRQLRFGET